MRRTFLALTLIVAIGLLSVSAATVKAQTGTALTLYAGEKSSSTYGFGSSSSNIASPGPTLNLVEGTTYTMTVHNVGTMDHSWEISTSKSITTTPLWGAGIDITTYISPGGQGSVTFTPTQTGNFYYLCTFPGHIELGMWGNVKVTSTSIPEYPSVLTLLFAAFAVTGLAAFLGRHKIRISKFPNL